MTWSICKLGQIARVFNGSTPSRMQPTYWQGGSIPWLSSGKVNDHVVETPSEYITERALAECALTVVPHGSVIMGMIGQGKTRGLSARLGIDAAINQNLAAIVPRANVDGQFLHHVLTAFYKEIRELGRGGNQEAMNCQIVSSLRIPVPPLDEQQAICQSLSGDLARVQQQVQMTQHQIELLREYRTRLIADVVTGKLDVRAAAASLPSEELTDAEVLEQDYEPLGEEEAAEDELGAELEEVEV